MLYRWYNLSRAMLRRTTAVVIDRKYLRTPFCQPLRRFALAKLRRQRRLPSRLISPIIDYRVDDPRNAIGNCERSRDGASLPSESE